MMEHILWNITPIIKNDDGQQIVELQWGWTAGLTPEEMENYAEDAPQGYDYVQTTPEMARELIEKLQKCLDELKES